MFLKNVLRKLRLRLDVRFAEGFFSIECVAAVSGIRTGDLVSLCGDLKFPNPIVCYRCHCAWLPSFLCVLFCMCVHARDAGEWWMTGELPPCPFERGVEVPFNNIITFNFVVCQDRLETHLLQLFAHPEN